MLGVEERRERLAALARCEREYTERPVIRVFDHVGRVMAGDDQVCTGSSIQLAVCAVPAAREGDRVILG